MDADPPAQGVNIACRSTSSAILERLTTAEAALRELESRREALLKESLLSDASCFYRRQQKAVEAVKAKQLDTATANAVLRAAIRQIVVGWRDGVLKVQWVGDGSSTIQFAWPVAAASRSTPETLN